MSRSGSGQRAHMTVQSTLLPPQYIDSPEEEHRPSASAYWILLHPRRPLEPSGANDGEAEPCVRLQRDEIRGTSFALSQRACLPFGSVLRTERNLRPLGPGVVSRTTVLVPSASSSRPSWASALSQSAISARSSSSTGHRTVCRRMSVSRVGCNDDSSIIGHLRVAEHEHPTQCHVLASSQHRRNHRLDCDHNSGSCWQTTRPDKDVAMLMRAL